MGVDIQSSLGPQVVNWATLPIEKKISTSIGRLLIKQAILGQLVGQYRHMLAEPSMVLKVGDMEIEINHCPTACTDGETVWYNREWCDNLSRNGMGFLILHEIGHNILSHHLRREGRDPERWNHAIDIAVNDMLLETMFPNEGDKQTLAHQFKGEPLAGGWDSHVASALLGLPIEATKGKSSEEIYSLLPPNFSLMGGGGSGAGGVNPGNMTGKFNEGRITLTPNELSEILTKARLRKQGKSEQEEINEQGQKLLRVVQTTKMSGTVPSAIQRIVDDLLEPQVNYAAVLRELLSRERKGDFSYANLSRRQEAYPGDIRIPGSGWEKGGGKIIVGFDTSGSIYGSKDLIDEMMSEVAGMQKDLDLELVLIYCDSQINKIAVFGPDDKVADAAPNDARRVLVGGGGTSFIPVFDWAEKHGTNADAIVYFTDLAGAFPEKSRFNTIWITFEQGKAPFGKTININRRAYEERKKNV